MVRFVFRFLTVLFAFVWLSGVAAVAQPVGNAVGVTQRAELISNGQTVSLNVGDPVQMGDTVVTSGNGAVQLLFNDETRIVVGPASRLVIDEVIMRQSDRASRFSVNALAGTFRFKSGKSPKSAYEINTPTATMGIRGTAFDFYVEQNRLTNVVMFEGEVRICPRGGECEAVSRRCSMSQASSTRSGVTTYSRSSRNAELRSHFPYVKSQARLRDDFRTSVSSCGNINEISKDRPKTKVEPPKAEPPHIEEPHDEEPVREEPPREELLIEEPEWPFEYEQGEMSGPSSEGIRNLDTKIGAITR